MTRRLETFGGNHIRNVVQAVELATQSGEVVEFEFNGRFYSVQPDDTYESAKARAEGVLGHPILTSEEEAERARLDLEQIAAKDAAAIAAAAVPTEVELRTAKVPWLKTPEELHAYINALVNRPHDYGTCVYAMSMAATAAFQYAAGVLGTTGFQASCADMDILRRTRLMDGPFILLKAEDLLYPQYDLREKLDEFIGECRAWTAEEAKKLLAESSEHTHPNVRRRWEELAGIDGQERHA